MQLAQRDAIITNLKAERDESVRRMRERAFFFDGEWLVLCGYTDRLRPPQQLPSPNNAGRC